MWLNRVALGQNVVSSSSNRGGVNLRHCVGVRCITLRSIRERNKDRLNCMFGMSARDKMRSVTLGIVSVCVR